MKDPGKVPDPIEVLSTDWGQQLTVLAPADPDGKAATVQAKIDASGRLGRIEVIDGGSKYDDRDGPILVGIPPPKHFPKVDISGFILKSD